MKTENLRGDPSDSGSFQFAIFSFQFSIPFLSFRPVALVAGYGRLIALHETLFIRGSMAPDAQIVKRALGPLLIHISVSRILRITLAAVTRDALHEDRYAAELGALVMTANALSALFCLMREVAARIQIPLVVSVPKQHNAACSVGIELDDPRSCVIGCNPVAIALLLERTRQHGRGHHYRDHVQG
jgi:hypothetical protein